MADASLADPCHQDEDNKDQEILDAAPYETPDGALASLLRTARRRTGNRMATVRSARGHLRNLLGAGGTRDQRHRDDLLAERLNQQAGPACVWPAPVSLLRRAGLHMHCAVYISLPSVRFFRPPPPVRRPAPDSSPIPWGSKETPKPKGLPPPCRPSQHPHAGSLLTRPVPRRGPEPR